MPAKPLTPSQIADAQRLKLLFRAWQEAQKDARKPFSQEHCSQILGFGQSTINQYVNGRIPLNINAVNRFAQLIGAEAEQISPDLAEKIDELTGALAAESPRPARKNDDEPTPISWTGGPEDIAHALQLVASAIERTDDLTWTQGAALLRRLADEPGRAQEIMARMGSLFGAQSQIQETPRAAA